MNNDYMAAIFEAINRVLDQKSNFFEYTGMELFVAFGTIIASWFGIQAALSAAEGGPGFSWSRFATLAMEMSFVYGMLAYYTHPIPGVGMSFPHLVLDQSQWMIGQLGQGQAQLIIESLNEIELNLPYPTVFEAMSLFRFMIVELCIIAAQAVTLYVVMLGYIATAILLVLGPVFIPFKLVPQMDWLFWGWFRAFIQYSFYQVVAAVYVLIAGEYLLQFLGKGPLSTGELAIYYLPLCVALVPFVLITIKIPAITFSLFSGRSGDYVLFRWR